MEQSSTTTGPVERKGLRFYGPGDELPPGGEEALERRSLDELQAAADRAVRAR